MMQTNRILGGHISVAGGLDRAPPRADEVGCRAMQIFVKNQRQWKARPLTDEDVARFRAALDSSAVQRVLVHSSYLINLGSQDPAQLQRSIEALIDEMERCERLGIGALVLHPGAHGGAGEEAGTKVIASSLGRCIATAQAGNVRLLLETTAGQGTSIGHRLEQLSELREMSACPDRIGICVDTCHVFAAGYDIGSDNGWEQMWRTFDRVLGADALGAVHVNDSRKPCGSRVDRHALLGMGHLGDVPLRRLMRDRRFDDVPLVLETPEGERHYEEGIACLERLR